ncbi:hypothetical protein [Longitalea arenae]|uniref:hypothetical protein n=1 Tax=Longitalea arenae TaxID=2812558 RepID=UPI0019680B0F|nr:hypothetical protein [Longitalea arenae]
MTKQFPALLLLASLLSVFTACDKDDPIDEPELNLPQYHLKSIEWNNGLKGAFVYNADSSLQRIDYTYRNVAGSTEYGWQGNKLVEMYDDRSSYKNVFEYDAGGKVVRMINREKVPTSDRHYTFDFIYNSSGKLDSLRYSITNEAGTSVKTLSRYYYNSAGELEKVITKQGNNEITHTIDSWSPLVSFEPANYLDPSLVENYPVYNLALVLQLHKIKKLPAKVTRIVQLGADPSFVDKIEEHVYTVTDYRIEKVASTTRYPQMPDYTVHLDAVYHYY